MINWFLSDGAAEASRAEVLKVGTTYMNVVGISYLIFAIVIIANGFLRGVGYMRGYFIVTFLDLITRVAGSYILADYIGYNAIWWAIPLGWVVGVVLAFAIIAKRKWKVTWIQG